MKRPFLLLPLLVLLFAQCTYTEKVRDGQTAIEVKQYAVAVDLLQKEYEKSKSRIEKGKIAYRLGMAYKNLNQSEQSIRWFQIAYDNQYGYEALREYAYALKEAERYPEAQRAFKDLGIEIGSPYEYRREISACDIAQGWKALTPEYDIELMDFNTSQADYAPMLYQDNQLVITSDRGTSTGDETYNWTGNSFSDLFVVDLRSGIATSFAPVINSEDNEGTAVFNDDYSEMYFTRCYGGGKWDEDFCKIMYSKRKGDTWSAPEPLSFIEDGVNYGGPSLSTDGKQLFFSSDHPDGWGGHDIYVAERQDDGNWGPPQLMTRVINTTGDEKFPYADHDTLYFASDAHTGMGGLDIFRTYKLQSRGWASPYNLKPPINSGSDDFGFVIDYQAPKQEDDIIATGYFTSRRDEGIGNDDIYGFIKRIPPDEPVVQQEDKPEDDDYKLLLTGYVLEKIRAVPTDPNSEVLGRKPLSAAKVEITFGPKSDRITVGEDGKFELELAEDTDYNFLALKEGYLNNAELFSTKGIGRDPNNPVQEFEIEIVLDKIFLNQEIQLENIYYDFDKADIREDAQPTLNELARNLQLNPDIQIELGSHTDCRGNNRYNQDLSQRRAQSAVNYLIEEGIDPSRLIAFGYGESEPAVDCICNRCTEQEHQTNRRTTFKIME